MTRYCQRCAFSITPCRECRERRPRREVCRMSRFECQQNYRRSERKQAESGKGK